ncbi:hypothetical protein BJ508DRAFT_380759 [Ascobolus immersus RN42]|uniref:Uncharacterized protein n=1 Tax=Ascobolus immersus RN42 TaxID=1160509 RepID=A0A3N4HJN6_ASCIM|nr:hypothetical protein BJ508DRAFT_380759 [Ascobolus immersus RN42]
MTQMTIDRVTKRTSSVPAVSPSAPAPAAPVQSAANSIISSMALAESPALRAFRERQDRELAEMIQKEEADRVAAEQAGKVAEEESRRIEAAKAAEERRDRAAETRRAAEAEEAAAAEELSRLAPSGPVVPNSTTSTLFAPSRPIPQAGPEPVASSSNNPAAAVEASTAMEPGCGVIHADAEADFFTLLGKMKRAVRATGGEIPSQVFLDLSAVLSRASRGQAVQPRPGSVSTAPIDLEGTPNICKETGVSRWKSVQDMPSWERTFFRLFLFKKGVDAGGKSRWDPGRVECIVWKLSLVGSSV